MWPMDRYSTGRAKPKAGMSSRFWASRRSAASRRRCSNSAAVRETICAPNPASAMSWRRTWDLVRAGSYTICAVSEARFTSALMTPSALRSTRSMRAEHAAQVMPVRAKNRVASPLAMLVSNSAPKPASATLAAMACGLVWSGSKATVSVSAARLTSALATPSVARRMRSMRAEQAAQCMPVIRARAEISSAMEPPCENRELIPWRGM